MINKCIKNIKFYDATMFHLKEVQKSYEEYLKKLNKLSDNEKEIFLKCLLNLELFNTQEMENVDRMAIEMDKLTYQDNSITYLVRQVKNNPYSNEIIKKAHQLLVRGTESEFSQNYHYRTKNVKVGKIIDNKEIISYEPIDYEEIEENMNEIIEILNGNIFDNVFLKPFIVHALIAIIQPFVDGNTRLARLIQSVEIMRLTNEKKEIVSYPTLYLTGNYRLNRGYRRNIGSIALNPNEENWNLWFEYNLKMVDEQLFYLNNEVKKYIK